MRLSRREWRASDSDTLERVLSRLIEVERLSGWSRTNAVGELIMHSFFGGSVQVWRSRSREKCGSLRRLAAHPDCPLRKSALSDAVNCFLFFRDNPRVSQFRCVTPGHVTIALRAGDAKALALLEEADMGQWSIRQLAAQVRLEQPMGAGSREPFTSSLRRIERRFLRAVAVLGEVGVCDPVEASELAASLEMIRERLSIIAELIAPVERSSCDSNRPRSEIVGLREAVASSH